MSHHMRVLIGDSILQSPRRRFNNHHCHNHASNHLDIDQHCNSGPRHSHCHRLSSSSHLLRRLQWPKPRNRLLRFLLRPPRHRYRRWPVHCLEHGQRLRLLRRLSAERGLRRRNLRRPRWYMYHWSADWIVQSAGRFGAVLRRPGKFWRSHSNWWALWYYLLDLSELSRGIET